MSAFIRYCLFLGPVMLMLAGLLWLAVTAEWIQPHTALLTYGLLLLIAVLLYPAFNRLSGPGAPIGVKALLGRETTLVRKAAPVGRVRLDGELWRARSRRNERLPVGTRVRVVDADGLELIVEALPQYAGDDETRASL